MNYQRSLQFPVDNKLDVASSTILPKNGNQITIGNHSKIDGQTVYIVGGDFNMFISQISSADYFEQINISHGSNKLHRPSQTGNHNVLKQLVKLGGKLEIKQQNVRYTLHDAAFNGIQDYVEYFLEYGIDVNTKDTEGTTPLHCAAKGGKLNVIKYLIEKGANLKEKSNSNESVLDYALIGGDAECIEFLTQIES